MVSKAPNGASASFSEGRLVDFLQIRRDGLALFPGDIAQAVADHVDDAQLDLGLGESGLDGFGKGLVFRGSFYTMEDKATHPLPGTQLNLQTPQFAYKYQL